MRISKRDRNEALTIVQLTATERPEGISNSRSKQISLKLRSL